MPANPFLQPVASTLNPRIVINIDPTTGSSTLTTRGNLSIPIVIDTLLSQLTSLWGQWMREISKGVVNTNGTPTGLASAPKTAEEVPE
jgi:hypothetical protein